MALVAFGDETSGDGTSGDGTSGDGTSEVDDSSETLYMDENTDNSYYDLQVYDVLTHPHHVMIDKIAKLFLEPDTDDMPNYGMTWYDDNTKLLSIAKPVSDYVDILLELSENEINIDTIKHLNYQFMLDGKSALDLPEELILRNVSDPDLFDFGAIWDYDTINHFINHTVSKVKLSSTISV